MAQISNGGMLSRKGGRSLMWLFELATIPVVSRWNKSSAKKSYDFIRFCHKMHRDSGIKFLVLYLKASQVLLQQCIGGYKVPDTRAFKVAVSRTRTGMPRIIPKLSREKIRSRDKGEIRF